VEPGRRWLHKRWAVSYKMPAMFDAGAWVDTCEVATSWGKLEALYRSVREAVSPHAFVMAHFSHAWPDGCSIYFTFSGAARTPEQGLRAYDATWRAALDAATATGATITHHHGVGLLKEQWLENELGPGGVKLLRATRRACDPNGIMNPGKLLP
jgi:alkyldihydroxyacetonephosphate synthase